MRIFLKILKWAGLALLLAAMLLVGLPHLPVLKDGMGAGKYRDWLAAEMVPLDPGAPDAGIVLPDEIGEARLIMLSEMHGYRAVQRLDIALLRYLNENHGVRAYLAEMSPAQAMAVNEYISGGNDDNLRRVFDYWAEENAQWGNREFFEKLGLIRQLNEGLPEERKIWFIGVDQIYDRDFAEEMYPDMSRVRPMSPSFADGGIAAINLFLLGSALDRDPKTSRYGHILESLDYILSLPGAEDEVMYGLWGLFHGSKVTINGSKPLAMRLNEEGGAFEGRVITIGTVCIDGCFNMMPAAAAPPPFQPKNGEDYVLLPMNFDDTYLMRLRGIGEVKKAMGEARLALIPLSKEGSPYLSGPHLTDSTGYMSMLQGFDYGGPGGEAMDYLIVMRGSGALTPWKGEAYDVTGGNAAEAGIY